jgi:prepilin-type N-terminal cleavage/methylation domain-containing protein
MKKLMQILKARNLKSNRGFTLIEILVVIGIIAVLAAIVIIAINPARQFAQARDTQRQSNVDTILNAIGQKLADSKGVFAGGTPACPALTATTLYEIGTGAVPTAPATAMIDLSCLTPTYIPSVIPTDPVGGSAANTGYDVVVDALGRYTISAPKATAETALGATPPSIVVTR